MGLAFRRVLGVGTPVRDGRESPQGLAQVTGALSKGEDTATPRGALHRLPYLHPFIHSAPGHHQNTEVRDMVCTGLTVRRWQRDTLGLSHHLNCEGSEVPQRPPHWPSWPPALADDADLCSPLALGSLGVHTDAALASRTRPCTSRSPFLVASRHSFYRPQMQLFPGLCSSFRAGRNKRRPESPIRASCSRQHLAQTSRRQETC